MPCWVSSTQATHQRVSNDFRPPAEGALHQLLLLAWNSGHGAVMQDVTGAQQLATVFLHGAVLHVLASRGLLLGVPDCVACLHAVALRAEADPAAAAGAVAAAASAAARPCSACTHARKPAAGSPHQAPARADAAEGAADAAAGTADAAECAGSARASGAAGAAAAAGAGAADGAQRRRGAHPLLVRRRQFPRPQARGATWGLQAGPVEQ